MVNEIEMQKLRDIWVRERIDSHARRLLDEADKDYICARMAYRSKFGGQFLWSSLQSIEKYLKCILLLCRVPSKNLMHNIEKAFKLVKEKTFCEIGLSQLECEEFIKYVNGVGAERYGDTKQYVESEHLAQLDKTVFSIRLYCQISLLTCDAETSPSRLSTQRQEFLQRINGLNNNHFHKLPFKTIGMLEAILDRDSCFERDALVWQNQCFGEPSEQSEVLQMYSLRSGLWDVFENFSEGYQKSHPQLYKELSSLIFIPHDVRKRIEGAIKKNGSNDV